MAPPQSSSGQEEPLPSPEEMLALLEMLQQQGISEDKIPPDLKTLVDNVKRQKAAKGGAPVAPDAPTEEITPEPGFVIKTSEVASGLKVFINVCSSPRVAAPGSWQGGVMPDEVAAALDKMQASGGDSLSSREVEALRFPLACGPPRPDADRKGQPCTAVDVVFNDDVVRAAGAARKLKALLIEIATSWVGGKLGAELDARYKLPKMRYKGEVVEPQRIRADDKRKPLVTELKDVDEEPSFALRTTKPPPPPPSQPPQPSTANQPQAHGQKPGGSSSAAPAGAGRGAVAGTGGTGPSGTAAGTSGSSSSSSTLAGGGWLASQGVSTTPSGYSYTVDYEGRPVEWVRVTVSLPPGTQLEGSAGFSVEAAGRNVFIRGPGMGAGGSSAGAGSQGELQVPLLFTVGSEGAVAEVVAAGQAEGGRGGGCAALQLVVRLPYRSLDEHVSDLRANAPLAFGQLGFAASKALLELEP